MHNGNLTNSSELKEKLFRLARRHVNTNSDSELLLNILANHLDHFEKYQLDPQDVFSAVKQTHQDIRGAYACIAMIIGHGMVAARSERYPSVSVRETRGKWQNRVYVCLRKYRIRYSGF